MANAFRALTADPKGHEGHLCFIEPTPKRIRVMFAGETIADSTNAVLMQETSHSPVYYIPLRDVRMDLLEATDNRTH